LPELTARAASLLRFLEHHADADGVLRPESGVTYTTVPQQWADYESANNPVPLGGIVEASADDFEDVLSELVMKRRLQADPGQIRLVK
jgi:hypothetical protein